MESIKNAVHSVISAMSADTHEVPSLTKVEVVAFEEQERTRRVNQASQSHVDQENAKKLADIVSGLQFPVLQSSNAGFKRFTKRSQEHERHRILNNKTEYELRKMQAAKVSSFIRTLGWPFYRAGWEGPQYIIPDPTALQEEEERLRRLNNPSVTRAAKENAASVAGIASWAHFKMNPLAGSKRYTRRMEETERKRRIMNPQEQEWFCGRGYTEARCIRNLGYPFFVQGKDNSKAFSDLEKLEEKERERRLNSKKEQTLAKTQGAAISAGLLSAGLATSSQYSADALEDKEQARRLLDLSGQQLSREHAAKVSQLVSSAGLAQDIQEFKEFESAPLSKDIQSDSVDVNALVEAERSRLLLDWQSQRTGRELGAQVASLIASRDVSYLMDKEKSRRLALHGVEGEAMRRSNAHRVSNIIKANASGNRFGHLEQEKTRRLTQPMAQMMALQNASKVASIVKQANFQAGGARSVPPPLPPKTWKKDSSSLLQAPIVQAIPQAPIQPIQQILAPQVPIQPVEQILAPQTPVQPLLEEIVVVPQPSFVEEPILASGIDTRALVEEERSRRMSDQAWQQSAMSHNARTSGIVNSAHSVDVQKQETTSARAFQFLGALPAKSRNLIQKAGLTKSGTTQYSSGTTQYSSGTTQYSSSPIAVGTTYTYTDSSRVPPIPGGVLGSGVHSEKERKALQKQANKHAKQAAKESRKAEKAMVKAEALHARHKDSRANRREQSAEKHALAAKHHQHWAQDAQLLAGTAVDPNLVISKNSILPSPTPATVFRPAM